MSSRGLFVERRCGMWVAIFGPDGVGKSAVIERLRRQLDGEFDGSAQLHFRPRVGAGGQVRAPVTRPHGRRPRGLLVSIVKLIYWLLDCWAGYLFFVCPRLRKGQVVIFDRYLPDVIVDPARYRLPASVEKIAAALAGLAPQPDLYILLDATAETVQCRKREVPAAETHRQCLAYRMLFESLPGAVVVNANRGVNQVAQSAAALISSCHTTYAHAQAKLLVNISAD
jgi:thymidylate kinase